MNKLLPLFNAREQELLQMLQSAKSGENIAYAAESYLEELQEEFKGGLTIPQTRLILPTLEILRQYFYCLVVASCSEENLSRQDPSRQVQRVLFVGLLLLLMSALAARASWLGGMALVFGLSIAVLEWLPWFFPVTDSLKVSPSPNISPSFKSNPKRLIEVLRNAVTAFDQAAENLDRELQAANMPPPVPGFDLDFVEFLQNLLGDSRVEDSRFLRKRTKQIPSLLKRMGMTAVWFEDTEQEVDEGLFQKIVAPGMSKITTEFPAIVNKKGVVLEGRVAFPARES